MGNESQPQIPCLPQSPSWGVLINQSMELKDCFFPVNGVLELMLKNKLNLNHAILWRLSLHGLEWAFGPIKCFRPTLSLPKRSALTTPGFSYKILLFFNCLFFSLSTVSLIRKILTPTSTPRIQFLQASQMKRIKNAVCNWFLWHFCPNLIIS